MAKLWDERNSTVPLRIGAPAILRVRGGRRPASLPARTRAQSRSRGGFLDSSVPFNASIAGRDMRNTPDGCNRRAGTERCRDRRRCASDQRGRASSSAAARDMASTCRQVPRCRRLLRSSEVNHKPTGNDERATEREAQWRSLIEKHDAQDLAHEEEYDD